MDHRLEKLESKVDMRFQALESKLDKLVEHLTKNE
jgi:hypothetical protein